MSLRGGPIKSDRRGNLLFMPLRYYFVYITTNVIHTTLYTGVTNHLTRRIFEHKFHTGSSFTAKYKAGRLVYFETFTNIKEAIAREKQIKADSRRKKIKFINSMNPGWEDLFKKILW